MMTVLGCIVHEHDLRLVGLAALLCSAGSWVAATLYRRTTATTGVQRIGWHVLTALVAGAAIWCTHFVAMLGFDIGVPVRFDLNLTIVSLVIAVIGAACGFAIAGERQLRRFAPAIGGAVVGLSIAAMHYIGMMAYRVQGIVSWDMAYLLASIVLSVTLTAAALHCAALPSRHAKAWMAFLLGLAIVSLHFTGMTAFHVQPMVIEGLFSNPEALHTLALAVAGMAMIIVVAGLVSYIIDDSVRAESVEHLRLMALSDTLTGLPNRANFNERLDLEIELARARGGKLALIGIDLNRFKEINDLRGHQAGDEVLRVLGRRMNGLLRVDEGGFVARVGGDEFSVLFRVDEARNLADFLGRLDAALSKPVRLEGFEASTGGSMGVAIWPDDANSKEGLINNADLAMYRAKGDPTRRVCFYEPAMDERVRHRRRLAAELREALARNQLSLHYQVQTSISTGQIQGYEALLRWHHPRLGFIQPTEFVPIAEENGFILEIGEWVLRHACADAALWSPPYRVAVNLSTMQLIHANLPKLVMDVLAETGLSPDRLELELTESTIFSDREHAFHMLRQIKALGVGIALDEFGAGHSSLHTLRSFPFDRIKIDRSFFSTSPASHQTTAIIRTVLSLGRSFGIPVLAEGIETYDQLSMLNTEGCDEAQGFLLGHPSPLTQIVSTGQIKLAQHGGGMADRKGPDVEVSLSEFSQDILLIRGACQ